MQRNFKAYKITKQQQQSLCQVSKACNAVSMEDAD